MCYCSQLPGKLCFLQVVQCSNWPGLACRMKHTVSDVCSSKTSVANLDGCNNSATEYKRGSRQHLDSLQAPLVRLSDYPVKAPSPPSQAHLRPHRSGPRPVDPALDYGTVEPLEYSILETGGAGTSVDRAMLAAKMICDHRIGSSMLVDV